LGATENASVVKTLLADLVERGLQPDTARLFIDGAKALSRAIRDTFRRLALIQCCQVHKGRNIIEPLDSSLHAGVKKVLRQSLGQSDCRAGRTGSQERRPDHDAPGVSASIHKGLDECPPSSA
jgi:putative transposase